MSYHIVGLRLVCDGAQRDRGDNVHVVIGSRDTWRTDVSLGRHEREGKEGASFPCPLQPFLCFLERLCSNRSQLLSSKTNDA